MPRRHESTTGSRSIHHASEGLASHTAAIKNPRIDDSMRAPGPAPRAPDPEDRPRSLRRTLRAGSRQSWRSGTESRIGFYQNI
ncbi:hypothetical protein EYF80_022828 [Liparis tanakae]|uniref:Uncharacterized protein n=1 Tax=Liparis tanakae TaxID=230148 RepID=A0A4Z2HMZ4_9TELE|nr:hypothetical protein EYF80_022828 [Liparis tanakae]